MSDLTEDNIIVLAALRDASALRREPAVSTPDGLRRNFTITELVAEGLMLGGDTANREGIAELDKAARGLYKKHLVARRTMFGVTRYTLTDEGITALAQLEEAAGVTDLVRAERDLAQAIQDQRAAATRAAEARERLAEEKRRFSGSPALLVLLDARRKSPLGR